VEQEALSEFPAAFVPESFAFASKSFAFISKSFAFTP